LSRLEGRLEIPICVIQQFRLSYGINPFKDDVVCDVAPLEVFDVLLGQPYMWKHHPIYESHPHGVIVTLGGQLYKVPELALTTSTSLISKKQCRKVISQTTNLSLFTIQSDIEQKFNTTTTASTQDVSIQ
jgi:hypothetical protein